MDFPAVRKINTVLNYVLIFTVIAIIWVVFVHPDWIVGGV